MQQNVKPPLTVLDKNAALQRKLQQQMSVWTRGATSQTNEVWQNMNSLLSHLTAVGRSVAKVEVLPLANRLMYLYAGLIALALLATSIALGL